LKIAVTILKCTETLANLRCEVSGAEEARGCDGMRAMRQREEAKARPRSRRRGARGWSNTHKAWLADRQQITDLETGKLFVVGNHLKTWKPLKAKL
jgi:hypothetical protein